MKNLAAAIKQQGATTVAEALGITVQRLLNWTARGVPVEFCAPLESALSGAVTRRDLRPDDWHLIWPELTESEPNQPSALAECALAAIKTEVKEGANV